MPRKKQINLIISICVVLISAVLFLFFSPEEVKNSNNKVPSASPVISDVFKREVLGGEITSQITQAPTPSLAQESEEEIQYNSLGYYQVVKVVDGDTIDVDVNGTVERLRLIGIDTPETVDPRKKIQCFGIEASNKTKELLLGNYVSLQDDLSQSDRDKYKRLLRYIFLEDGTNFNLYMIQEGFAYEYTYDNPYKFQLEFKSAQLEAQNSQKGLWNSNTCSGQK